MQKLAVIAARLATRQQACTVELQDQVKKIKKYAVANHFSVEHVISQNGTGASDLLRELVDFLRKNRHVRVVLVEKTDRLFRNLHDFVLLEDLIEERDIEVHLINEGQVLRKATKSQDRLVQEVFALLARNYTLNLQEEILKGQLVKAEKGQYPGRARYGYVHDRETRTIVAHPTGGPAATMIFEVFSTGRYTVKQLTKVIFDATGEHLTTSKLHGILQSRFYLGLFSWRGKEYPGIHPTLVNSITFDLVQDIISGKGGNGPDGAPLGDVNPR